MKRIISLIMAALGSASAMAATSSVPLDGKTAHGYSIESFLPLIIIVVLFYLLFFLPQRRRQKAHKQMLTTLEKGAEVLTNSGMVGVVASVKDGYAEVEIAKGVVVKMQQETIGQVLPKGTVKSL